MTDNEKDPAEEYFKTLESLVDMNDPQWRMIIANARNDYRQQSRYTDTYWNQREEYLKTQALKHAEQREYYSLPWYKRIFTRRPQ